jgi:phage tail P2-like protein
MAKRRFDTNLIPPSINDARIRYMFAAFDAMLSEFHFADLLMQTSNEMPDEVLELAVADRSLEEFIDEAGSPELAVRKLIDNAFALHETQGTDPGIIDALAAFGMSAEIIQWYEQNPPGPPHTHKINVDTSGDIFGDGEVFGPRTARQADRIVNAMKRWSQNSAIRLAAMKQSRTFAGLAPMMRLSVTALPLDITPPVIVHPSKVGIGNLVQIRITAQPKAA